MSWRCPWAVAPLNNQSSTPTNPVQPQRIVSSGTGSIQTFFWQFLPNNPGVTALNYGNKNAQPRTFFNTGLSMYPGLPNNGQFTEWEFGPSSDHSGLVLHAFGDAHVQSIDQAIDATLYIQLCTKAGKEPATVPE